MTNVPCRSSACFILIRNSFTTKSLVGGNGKFRFRVMKVYGVSFSLELDCNNEKKFTRQSPGVAMRDLSMNLWQ